MKQVLDLEPENLFAQLNLGELKIEQNNFEEAISIYEKIFKKNKNFQNIIMRLANTYSIIGEFKKAEEYFSIASKKTPDLFAFSNSSSAPIFLKKLVPEVVLASVI